MCKDSRPALFKYEGGKIHAQFFENEPSDIHEKLAEDLETCASILTPEGFSHSSVRAMLEEMKTALEKLGEDDCVAALYYVPADNVIFIYGCEMFLGIATENAICKGLKLDE